MEVDAREEGRVEARGQRVEWRWRWTREGAGRGGADRGQRGTSVNEPRLRREDGKRARPMTNETPVTSRRPASDQARSHLQGPRGPPTPGAAKGGSRGPAAPRLGGSPHKRTSRRGVKKTAGRCPVRAGTGWRSDGAGMSVRTADATDPTTWGPFASPVGASVSAGALGASQLSAGLRAG